MQDILSQYETVQLNDVKVWFKAGKTSDFPTEGGGCIKYKKKTNIKFVFYYII